MNFRSSYDYIVVGAGSAGCLLASRLAADPACRVLLLEAGGDQDRRSDVQRPAEYLRLQGTPLDWNYRTVAAAGLAGRSMNCPRGRMLGGSSGINAVIYHEGEPDDFDAWQQVAGKSWSREAIAAAMRQMRVDTQSLLWIESPAEIAPACQAFVEAASAACGSGIISGTPEVYRRTTRQGTRQSAMQAFLGHSPPANLTIGSNVLVQRVQILGGRAAGVIVGDATTAETITAAKGVILTAGAIGSPQLLMLSGVGPRELLETHGITVRCESPHVGANLTDHLAFPVIFATPRSAPFPSRWSMRDLARWNYLQRGPIASNLAEAGGFFDLPASSGLTAEQRHRAIQLHVTPTHYLRYPAADAPAAMTLAVTGSQPRSRGSIALQSANVHDAPIIDPGYLSDPLDAAILTGGVELARQIAACRPLVEFIDRELLPGEKRRDQQQIERSIRRFAMTLYHPVGSCSMGVDPSSSVVDPRFRVHAVEGLYVADASVFPAIPRANPQAAVMMIAHRAAEMI